MRPPAPCPSVALVPGAGLHKSPAGGPRPPTSDRIITFADGRGLFEEANEPKVFVTFDSPHRIDPAVGSDPVGRLTQIYGP